MAGRKINPILKQVLELGPTVVFFLIYMRIKDQSFSFAERLEVSPGSSCRNDGVPGSRMSGLVRGESFREPVLVSAVSAVVRADGASDQIGQPEQRFRPAGAVVHAYSATDLATRPQNVQDV